MLFNLNLCPNFSSISPCINIYGQYKTRILQVQWKKNIFSYRKMLSLSRFFLFHIQLFFRYPSNSLTHRYKLITTRWTVEEEKQFGVECEVKCEMASSSKHLIFYFPFYPLYEFHICMDMQGLNRNLIKKQMIRIFLNLISSRFSSNLQKN
jgi:hypothetical protein